MTTAEINLSATIDAARRGDRDAFGELVRRYADVVTGVAYAVIGDFGRSEDVAQESFTEAWRKLATLKSPEAFPSWVCTIARRRAIDDGRRGSVAGRHSTASLERDPVGSSDPPDAGVTERERRELVWRTLDVLPETYREAMVLYYRREQSVAEVAEALAIAPETVRQRLARGRRMVREELTGLVEQTLRSSAPKALFAAAVMASIPTTAAASVTAATATAGTKAAAGAGGLGSAAAMWTWLGPMAGVLGGAFGAYRSYRSATDDRQRRLIVGATIFTAVWLVAFLVLFGWLLATFRAGHINSPVYTTRLSILVATAQLAFWAVLFPVMSRLRKYQIGTATKLAESADDGQASDVETSAAYHWISRRRWVGSPWIEIRLSRRIGGVHQPGPPARGVIAIGNSAHGRWLAIGGDARGPIAIGGRAVGLIAVGGVAVGALTFGGLSLGLISVGSMAIGGLALGALAIGWEVIGAMTIGHRGTGAIMFGREMGPPVWVTTDVETLMIQFYVAFGAAALCAFAFIRIMKGRLRHRDNERLSDSEAWLGGIAGSSAWAVGLAYDVGRFGISAIACVLYAGTLIAAVFRMRRHRDADVRRRTLASTVVATTLIAMGVLITLRMVGVDSIRSVWWGTWVVVLFTIQATVGLFVAIMTARGVEVSDDDA